MGFLPLSEFIACEAAMPGVIDRFSEDIDLSMSPAFVGADETVFEGLKIRTQRDVALAPNAVAMR